MDILDRFAYRNSDAIPRNWNMTSLDSDEISRRFDGMSHTKDDLELFRFVMVCNVALKSSLEV